MKQQKYTGKHAQNSLQNSLKENVKIVSTSYGFNGKNTIMEDIAKPAFSTNDGIRIINANAPLLPIDRVAKKLLLDVAKKTENVAGDGTTTAILLAASLSINMIELIKQKKYTIKQIEDKLTNFYENDFLPNLKIFSYKIETREDAYKLAYISSRSEKLANLIADIFVSTGDNCFTQFKENQKESESKIDIFKGIIFDGDVFGEDFWNDKVKMETILKDAKIVLTNKTLSSLNEVFGRDFEAYGKAKEGEADFVPYNKRKPTIYNIARENKWDTIFLVCNDIDQKQNQLLTNFKSFWKNSDLKIFPIKAPYDYEKQTSLLEDLAAMTGAKVIDNHKGMSLENFDKEFFGSAKEIIINPNQTKITGIKGDKKKIKERRENLEILMKNPEYFTNQEVFDFLIDRKKTLSDETATLYIAGKTETETGDLLTRGEDALNTVSKAKKDGYVAGGGSIFLKVLYYMGALKDNDDFTNALIDTLLTPMNSLIFNSENNFKIQDIIKIKNNKVCSGLFDYFYFLKSFLYPGEDFKYEVYNNLEFLLSEDNTGINLQTMKVGDLKEAGIIDSVTSVKASMEYAISLAKTLAKTENIFAENNDSQK